MKKLILIITIFIVILIAGVSASIWNAKTGAPKNGLVAHWTMDADDINGTELYDKSGNDNSCTLVNTPTQSEGRIEGALDFDSGSSEYLNCGAKSDFNFTNGITVSLWIKGDTQTGNYVDIFKKNDAYSMQTWSNYPGFEPKIGASYYHANDTITLDSMKGTWYHLVGTYDGETVKYYRDAVIIDTNTDPSGPIATSGNSLVIAQATYGGDAYFNGSIDDVRAYNRALSAQEISELYNATSRNYKNSETKKGLIGHWTMDANDITSSTVVYDKSGNNYNGTLIKPSASATSTTGKIEEAVEFNGSTDYIQTTSGGITGNNPYSWSAWVNWGGAGGGNENLIINWGTTGSNNQITAVTIISGTLRVNHWGNDWNSGYSVPVDTWVHLAGSYDGADVEKVYVNGALNNTRSGFTDINTPASGFVIGNLLSLPGGTSSYDGKLDDMRVYNYALSAQEISELYNSAKTQFTASAPKNGLIAHYTMDANDITSDRKVYDKSGNFLNGTLIKSGATPTSTLGKIDEAVDFNGTTDWIQVPDNSLLKSTTTIALAAWVKLDSLTASKTCGADTNLNQRIIFKRNVNTIHYTAYELIKINGAWSFFLSVPGSSTTACNSTTAPVVGEWVHVVGTFNRPTMKIYVNGVYENSATFNNDISHHTRPLFIGRAGECGGAGEANWDAYLNGQIDDVRIYDRALSAEEIAQLYKSSARSYVR